MDEFIAERRKFNLERHLRRLRKRGERLISSAELKKVEMTIGEWYLDADGCMTREIKHVGKGKDRDIRQDGCEY